MYKKILIPLDNSATDETILTHIRAQAKCCKAALVLVHVADGFAARTQEQLNLVDSEEINKDRAYLERLSLELTSEGFLVKHYLLKGDPVSGIVRIAQEEGCDLIAMATHGHRFLLDWILGSVADGLRHKVDIPIMMIRAHRK